MTHSSVVCFCILFSSLGSLSWGFLGFFLIIFYENFILSTSSVLCGLLDCLPSGRNFYFVFLHDVCVLCSVAQSCLTLCDPVDCSLAGSSVDVISSKNTGVGCHFLLQGSLGTTTRTHIACIGRCTFCHWAIGQACICMMLLINRCWMKEMGHKVSVIGQ